MKKLLYGLSVASITAIPAFLATLAGCGTQCKCGPAIELPFPTSGSDTLRDVREGISYATAWEDSSWADVTAAELEVGEDQLFITLELESGMTVETILDITRTDFAD